MTPALKEPDVFTGTRMLANDIELGLNVLTRKVRDLKRATTSVDQKLAAEAIAKVSGQIQSVSETIGRITVAHLARRARV
jgi:hypothetical protein